MSTETEGPTWRYVAIGVCSLFFPLTGYLIGNFISSVTEQLATFKQTLDSRAGLATRLDALERAQADQENRLRIIEHEHWKQERKR
ncbi:MAG: hypothetical protein KGL39_18695 [Patescibacteria group bacterium]|nr:hypothetical protein [Patescibacteria group bacterium]